MLADIFPFIDSYIMFGIIWAVAGVATGIHAMGVWQSFQELEDDQPATNLGHQWFFMSCVCPPAAMLTTKMFFPDVKFQMPRWW